ncbi:sugar ABC transporter ATP-binding protein [Elstera cyanobacteriorum]|uniref:Sugar ABC transporter ATP-binding protein n=1 Tax=Elstera cyanobacteriorum TaxID=2022747 RepID=A0A255XT56_9PROT|nr:sugar ABC transporter ATP-binding protein [Elstera cyanobacteriorum]OYQ19440.1 sugar ABC transporter ATP-binding protein [Elstera cyanobacteriorum]GFZ91486.1 sugar ABC transporter ATP-binding protein [Elstera cyanobacteriorum]
MTSLPPVLTLTGITKRFPGVLALDGVDFDLYPGEVHALLGENGAGKSTLIKVLTGLYRRNGGAMRLDGAEINPRSPQDAQALGISTVYQEVNLVPTLTVAENLTLGRQPRRLGLIRWGAARAEAEALLKPLGLSLDVGRLLGSYSIAIQQMVAIARALAGDVKILILDEPTASLDTHEVEVLFDLLRRLKARGIAIVFVTHFLDQVYALSDRITVLRNGKRVGTARAADLPRRELVQWMLGQHVDAVTAHRSAEAKAPDGPPRLVAEGIGKRHMLESVDLSVHAGEVVGLAGLLGSGRSETVELLFGAARRDRGRVLLDGAAVDIRSPRQAIRHGFAFCPEDRKHHGIVADLSVRENIILALQARQGWLKRVPHATQQAIAAEMIDALGIRTPDGEKPVGQLSGGNQQKVILARWLITHPKLLLLDEPTRGIDVGAHAEIMTLIRKLCAEGMALLLVSSELEEITAVADRVVVLRDRRRVAELTGAGVTEAGIIEAIAQ